MDPASYIADRFTSVESAALSSPSTRSGDAAAKAVQDRINDAFDTLFGPERVTAIDDATQKLMSYPAGQLDWIGGFSRNSRGKILLETYLTPVLRCYSGYRHSWSRIPICESIARTRSPAILHAAPLSVLARVQTGGVYLLRKALADLPGVNDAKIHNAQPSAEYTAQNLVFDIHDDRCDAGPYRDVRRQHPEIAALITTWKPACPDTVGFFIAQYERTTIIIPTVEILRQCYFPNRTALEMFLMATETTPYLNRLVAFNGFGYVEACNNDVRCYPIRARANIERAEREISQLLPRAAAYHRRHGDLLPILIRPPFAGRVRLSGAALEANSMNGNRLLFFPFGVTFGPAIAAPPKRSSHTTMQFAPRLGVYGVSLPEVEAELRWHGAETWFGAHDVRLFPRMRDAVVRGIEDHTYASSPKNLFQHNDFGSYREWLLRHGRV